MLVALLEVLVGAGGIAMLWDYCWVPGALPRTSQGAGTPSLPSLLVLGTAGGG